MSKEPRELPEVPLCPQCKDHFHMGNLEIDLCMGCLINQLHKQSNYKSIALELMGALEKLESGPGNKMANWHITWASGFARAAISSAREKMK